MHKNDPDPDWEEKVAERIRSNGRSLGEGIYIPPDPKIAWTTVHPPDASMNLTFANDRLWIKHDDLLEVGYLHMEPDKVVFVNGAFYELQAYHRPTQSWWVEEIVVDGASEDLTPAMFTKWKKDADDA